MAVNSLGIKYLKLTGKQTLEEMLLVKSVFAFLLPPRVPYEEDKMHFPHWPERREWASGCARRGRLKEEMKSWVRSTFWQLAPVVTSKNTRTHLQ